MEFRILGPLEVRVHGAVVPVGGPKQRALLALLLLNPNRVVARDRLIDDLLGERISKQAEHALMVQVSRLRKTLVVGGRDEERLVTRPPGYLLRVDAGELDLDAFERLAQAGHLALEDGDAERAAESLREAESLWRGRPLADLEFEPFARVEIERLEERRLSVVEERIEAELALGRHAALVPELEVLVADHPLRELLRGRLMVALYRAGRQADALAVYRDARVHLSDQLGLEPGPELRRLEQAILVHDAALEPEGARVAAAVAVAEPPRPAALPLTELHEPRRSARRAWLPAAAGVIALGVGAVAIVASLPNGGSGRPGSLVGNGLVFVSAGGRLTATMSLPGVPTDAAAGFGSLWVTEANAGAVVRIDPRRRTVLETIRVGNGPSAIATGAGDVWTVNTLDGSVSRVDPGTDSVVQTIQVGSEPSDVVVDDGSVWVSNHGDGTVARIDAATGRLSATLRTGGGPSGVAASAGAVWVADDVSGTISRIDAQAGTVSDTIHVGDAPSNIAVAPGSVWVLDRLDSTVSRIDETTDSVAATYPAPGTTGLAVMRDGIWLAARRPGTLVRLDRESGMTRASLRVGGASRALAAGNGLWVTVQARSSSRRGGTLNVASTDGVLDTIDPASSDSPNVLPPQFLGLTNDSLVTLDHTAGPDGTRLVPDLALALPRPRDGGRTYVFQLRPGVRYSTGSRVRPRDVRSSFERLFQIHSSGADYFAAIAGATTCLNSSATCTLARGIVTDNQAGTVTFHLSHPDPDFLDKLTFAYADVLPASTPRRIAHEALPATGPYRIGRYLPGRVLLLVRNPYFREWSDAAQPAGYPDRINLRLGLNDARAATLVARGQADFAVSLGSISGHSLDYFLYRHPGQVHKNPVMITGFLFLNVKVPPFNDVRVRRAFNFALNRARIVSAYGGPTDARPTCQILPPGIPGYRRYCPYTKSAEADGAWEAPDLVTAKRLVTASHTRGMKVTVWNTAQPEHDFRQGQIAVATLRTLGYRATQRLLPDNTFSAYTNNSRNRSQVIESGWSADYPTANDFIGKLTCGHFVSGNGAATTDASEFCDPTLDRRIARAAALQTTDPTAANARWAELDRQLTNQAIWLPTVTPYETDLVSTRVTNYQYNPVWGPLIDQLWIKTVR